MNSDCHLKSQDMFSIKGGRFPPVLCRQGGCHTTMREEKICIIGAGNMGEALAGGIITGGLARAGDITVHDIRKERLGHFRDTLHVGVSEDLTAAVGGSATIILAVKPQNMEEVLKDMADAASGKLIISIAAGVTLGFMEKILGEETRVIRVMPNTPALIGEGAAALAGGRNATERDIAAARRIFDSVGMSVVVEEKLIDAVTGLSGSGPAYGFIIIDALAQAGVNQGLEGGTALKLAAQTMLGAARLCLNSGKTPAQLTDMVTSPGGTTIEGIKVLKAGKIEETLAAAVDAATRKSKELRGK